MAVKGTLILLRGNHSTFIKEATPAEVRARLEHPDDDGLVDLHGDGGKILAANAVVALIEAPE